MSYDIRLHDPITQEVLVTERPHELRGGTYVLGGTDEMWLNVTYNYSKHYRRVFGKGGIRTLYGRTGADSIPILKQAIEQLGDDVDDDYWKPTEGNAKQALLKLLAMASMRPDGVWNGD